MTFEPTLEIIQRIWHAHHLGQVEAIAKPKRGWANKVLFVNDSHVIRFDVIISEGISRWESERIAYDLLRADGIPVPTIVALDTSKSIVPYYYLIVNRLPGTPIVDSWPDLDDRQRKQLAHRAGEILAIIHGHTFARYGSLWDLATGGHDTWAGHVHQYYAEYHTLAVQHHALSPDQLTRLEKIVDKFDPLMRDVHRPAFVHWDYHFENILQQDGEITGILDFEWAIAGDPAWDFKQDLQWSETCPGSNVPLYAGYQTIRPLPGYHQQRATFYSLLSHLDAVALAKANGVQREYEAGLPYFFRQLEWLEANL
ncbi:MAG: aminoglycoside phosphotransferase family protein [Anaerolineae bacterium]|nr:aminoglycoside phosphotransferase family protein [Anaerolineae bacterium]